MANTTNWLSISSQSGSSGQTILTLSANKNLSAGTKTAEVTAYNPVYNISAKTYVTIDAYSPYIYVSDSIIGIPASGGTYQLGIESNCSFVIAYPNMVSTYSTSAGTGNISVTFSVPATYQSQTITENIVITDESGQYSIVVRLEQYGSEPEISAVPPELLFEANGGTLYFTVSANCVYHIDNSVISGWCGVSPQSGYTGSTTFTVTTTANTGDSAKTGIISVIGPGTAGDMVQVRQKRTTVQIPYTADTSTIEASGETRTITIDTTGLVDSSITVDIQNAPGATYTYSNGVITVTIPDNSGSTRDVVVSVTGKTTGGDDAATSITFPQAEHTTVQIPYTADTSTVDASGETRTITIDTSGLVTSSITIGVEGATGVTYTYNNGVVTVVFPDNSGSSRNITVNVTGQTINGNSANGTIVYYQSGGLATVEATYIVSSTTEPTRILYDVLFQYVTSGRSGFGKAEYNNVEIPLGTGYTFPTTGYQTVKFYLTAEEVPGSTQAPNSAGWSWGAIPGEDISYAGKFVPNWQFKGCPLARIVFGEGVFSVGEKCCGNMNILESLTFGPDIRNVYNNIIDRENNRNLTSITFYSAELPEPNLKNREYAGISDYSFGIYVPGRGITYPSNNEFMWHYRNTASNGKVSFWLNQLSGRKMYIQDGTWTPGIVSVTYNVTTTTGKMKIAQDSDRRAYYVFNYYQIEFPDGTIAKPWEASDNYTTYQFSSTGLQTIRYYLTGDTIDRGNFENLKNAKSVTLDCKGIAYVDRSYGFRDCTNLTSITFTNKVTMLNNLSGCTSIETIQLPDSLATLGRQCLSSCTSLSSVTFGTGSTNIGFMAVTDCNSLSIVRFTSQIAPTSSYANNIFYNSANNGTMYYPTNGTNYDTWVTIFQDKGWTIIQE